MTTTTPTQALQRPAAVPYNASEASVMLTLRESHKGRKNGIKAKDLACATRHTERDLRTVISGLRERGEAIAGKPETGYFLAITKQEIDEHCAWLISRAMKSLRLVSRMQKTAIPELLGQMAIEYAPQEPTPTN